MQQGFPWKKVLLPFFLLGFLGSCSLPRDYLNDYTPPNRTLEGTFIGGTTGLGAGALVGANVPASMLLGASLGGGIGYYQDSRYGELTLLQLAQIPVIRYGSQFLIVLPSDVIFVNNTARIKDSAEPFLTEIVGFMFRHAVQPIIINAHCDEIGTDKHKSELTQKQAQSILTYLWAHGIDYQKMQAVGWSDHQDAAENLTQVGSAMNRRIVIQFTLA